MLSELLKRFRYTRFLLVCFILIGSMIYYQQNLYFVTLLISSFVATTVLTVFGKLVYGNKSRLLLSPRWLFAKCVVIEPTKENQKWCKNNCNGKWLPCDFGAIAFKNKDDAILFRLTW